MGSEDDPDREAILARRRRLIAMALGGFATVACADPGPCLSAPFDPPPVEQHADPQPCLEPPFVPSDTEGDGPMVPIEPIACLTPVPTEEPPPPSEETTAPTPVQPRPRVCLTRAR